MGKTLEVPYSCQHERDAKRFSLDCGPACVEMVGEFYRGQVPGVGTDQIMAYMTGGRNARTSFTDLQEKGLWHFYQVKTERLRGVTLEQIRSNVDADLPMIALVKYGLFPFRMDRRYTGGHWVVIVGYDGFDWAGTQVHRVIIHDPDWYSTAMAQGGRFPVVWDVFEPAFRAMGSSVLVPVIDG